MLPDSCWLVLPLLWGLLWLAWTWRHHTCAPSENTAVTACAQRLLKPRTPDDCPACRRQSALPVANTPPASARVFGHRHATITTWLTRAGAHSTTLHDSVFRNLHLPHLQLGELRTRLRNRAHVLWLWVVVDPLSKIIPVLHHPEGTRGANPGLGAHGHSRPLCTAGSRLPARLYQR